MPNFSEIPFVRTLICVHVCVRPQGSNNYPCEIKPEYVTGKKGYTAFWPLYTAPTVNIANGRGCSREAHRELLSKKTKVRLH